MSDTLRLEHGVRAPGKARGWIAGRCLEWQCEDLAESASLLISELVTNVFLHARTDCLIRASFDRPLLTVTVSDGDGREFALPSPSLSAEDGRGLLILDALAHRWGMEHDDRGKSLWFHLETAGQPAS